MAQRICCLRCLSAIDAEAPVSDPLRQCAQCSLPIGTPVVPLTAPYFFAHLSKKLFDETARGNLSRATVKVELMPVPLTMVEEWVKTVAATAGQNHHDWDREPGDPLWKKKPGEKSWVLTTWAAGEAVCKFEEYVTPPDGERCMRNCRQLSGGDLVFLIGPWIITHKQSDTPCRSCIESLEVTFSSATIACTTQGFFRMSAQHPTQTADDTANKLRWPHLPLYSDFTKYMNFKSAKFVKAWAASSQPENQRFSPRTCGTLRKVAKKFMGKAPKLVKSRVASPGEFAPRTVKAYQHPKLTYAVTGFLTLKDFNDRKTKAVEERVRRERRAEERRAKAARLEYEQGRQLSLRLINRPGFGEEAREAYLAKDPRFNGEHQRLGYDGVGTPPEKRESARQSDRRLRSLGLHNVSYDKGPSFPHLNPRDESESEAESSDASESEPVHESESEGVESDVSEDAE